MRIVHFADLHIGVELYGRPLPDLAWSSRMQDFLAAFDAMVDYAIGERVDAVIFAGDAYKAREPSQTHQREFAKRIRRLSEAEIPTFLLVGNHDLPNAEGRAHVLEIYRTLGVPHVYVGDGLALAERSYRPQVIPTRSGPLQVAALPWPQVSRLLANREDVATMSIDQQQKVVEELLTGVVGQQAAALDPDVPAILTCHVSLNDFLVRDNPGSEQWMTVGSAPTLLKSSLSPAAFDYVALGHHHNNMDLTETTPMWYAGSMQPVDFGEEGQPKGFMVFDIDPAKPRGARVAGSGLPKLMEVPARRFVTVRVRPKEADPTPEVCAAVARHDVTDAIVRVLVECSRDQSSQFRQPEVRRLLEAAHYIQRVAVELPEDGSRWALPPGVQPDATSPIEALDLYFRQQQMEEARRERLRRAAEDLLVTVGGNGG
ncbi:MAG: exonuclease SbcCD subunit D [Dehalococcoidia bacterium]